MNTTKRPKPKRVPHGQKRQWVRCRERGCNHPYFYDYTPYGLGNPIMALPCGHGIGNFNASIIRITEAHAKKLMDKIYGNTTPTKEPQ